MNERIEQLWCQGTHAVMPKSNGYASVSAEEIKKFAELIVAECINMIETEAKNADEDDQHGMRNAAGLIGRAFITLR